MPCQKAYGRRDEPCAVEEYQTTVAKLKRLALRYRLRECFINPDLTTDEPTLTGTAFGDFIYSDHWVDVKYRTSTVDEVT